MVARWTLPLALAACATARVSDDQLALAMTAPKKAAALEPSRFSECTLLGDAPEVQAPTWKSLVLASDVTVSESGACGPLERALTPLAEATLSREALRAECEEKATALPSSVQRACRAVCAARRWLDARTLERQRLSAQLDWVRDEFDTMFDRIERCPATRSHGNQLADAQVHALFDCAGKSLAPMQAKFLFQYVTERVTWGKNDSISSSRPVEAEWLRVSDPDPNLPWSAVVTRCRRGKALERIWVRQP